MSVYTLQSHEAIARWDEIAALLSRIEAVDMPLADVKAKVASADAQVWCVSDPIEAVLLTQVQNTAESRFGLLWMAAGDRRLVAVANQFVEPWFKSMGCSYVRIIGRRGWKRVLPDYTEQSINLVKKL